MELEIDETLTENKSLESTKKNSDNFGWKNLIRVYGLWFGFSFILAYLNPQKFAGMLSDLPSTLYSLSPFVKAMIYLSLFIPAVVMIAVFTIYILFNVLHNLWERKNGNHI